MESITLFLLKFWGWYMTLLIAILIARPNVKLKVIEWVEKEGFMFIGGFIAFMIGLASVLLHNLWNSPNEIIVSLIGWMALLKGIMNVSFPNIASSFLKKLSNSSMTFYLVVALAFGIYLLMKAYLGI